VRRRELAYFKKKWLERIDGRMVLKLILGNMYLGLWSEFNWMKLSQVEDFCEHAIKPPDAIGVPSLAARNSFSS
jgi:hypothetical protein